MLVLPTLFGEFFATKKFPLRRHGSQTSGEASASVFRSEPDVRSAIFDAIAVTRFWHVSRVSSAAGKTNGGCGHLSRSLQIFNSDSELDRALFSFNNKRLMTHFTPRSVIVSLCPFGGRISSAGESGMIGKNKVLFLLNKCRRTMGHESFTILGWPNVTLLQSLSVFLRYFQKNGKYLTSRGIDNESWRLNQLNN